VSQPGLRARLRRGSVRHATIATTVGSLAIVTACDRSEHTGHRRNHRHCLARPPSVGPNLLGLRATLPGRGACGHPDGFARFVRGALDTFADDFGSHAYGRPCPAAGRPWLPLPTAGDPTPAGWR